MRESLDSLYRLSGYAGAVMLFLLLVMVVTQMIARWVEVPITGLTEIAGYCMGATSFFGLGYALSTNAHIRVNLVVGQKGNENPLADILCTLAGSVLAAALAYFAIKTTVLSHRFQEISQGQDEMPVWIPQIAMSVGAVVLFVALIDRLAGLLISSENDRG